MGASAMLIALLALFGFAGISFAQKPVLNQSRPRPIGIESRVLAGFDKSDPARRRFGRLEWRGGLVLTSPASEFGGWSGLALDAEGRRLVAISDAGAWLTGELIYKGTQPAGIGNARIAPLFGMNGKPLARARDRDAESVTLADGGLREGTLLIGFEGNHRIGRFHIGAHGISAPAGYLRIPPEARTMRSNYGFEALCVLQGGPHKGAIVAFSEHLLDRRGHHTGWVWIDGQPRALFLKERDGYEITDAAALRDGGMLVLERRFRWTDGVRMRIRLLPPDAIAPDAVIEGETLLEAGMSYEIDNMEGIAVHRGGRGETVITLISDDNFNRFLQRTVLLQFTLLNEGLVGRAD